MREFARIAANLLRRAALPTPAILRALRDSRPLRYAWLAGAWVLVDALTRRLWFLDFELSQLAEYGGRVVLMATLWGGVGTLLRLAAQYARQQRFLAFFVVAPASGLATLSLLSVSAGHLAFLYVNRYFATPEMLRDVWSQRQVLASYAHDLPGVAGSFLVGVVLLSVALTGQAWHHSRELLPRTLGSAGFGLFLSCLAALVVTLSYSNDESPSTFAPPDSNALFLLSEAARPPPPHAAHLRREASRRDPVRVPPLKRPARMHNVLLILTESVRADAMCSDPHACVDPYVDPAASDRIPLSQLRTQAPGTFTTCMGPKAASACGDELRAFAKQRFPRQSR